MCAQSAAEVAKDAEQKLPPERGAEDATGCGVLVRFPDGQRRQRRFPRSATLDVLRAFCLVHSEEAAAGRPFALSESMPGTPCNPSTLSSIRKVCVMHTGVQWRTCMMLLAHMVPAAANWSSSDSVSFPVNFQLPLNRSVVDFCLGRRGCWCPDDYLLCRCSCAAGHDEDNI